MFYVLKNIHLRKLTLIDLHVWHIIMVMKYKNSCILIEKKQIILYTHAKQIILQS